PYSAAVSFVVVVMTLPSLSRVVGELAPKRLAVNYAEGIASRVAKPMRFLSRLTSPAVHALSASSSFLLRLLGARPTEEPPITEEEVKILIDVGTEAGVFEAAEHELVDNIFRLADLKIPQLMTPRLDIVWLDVESPPD